MTDLPNWIHVVNIIDSFQMKSLLKKFDKGEASSIALALETKNSLVIIDEIKGRKIAASYDLEIIGTIGILILAKNKGLIKDLIHTVQKLQKNGFRVSDKIIDALNNTNLIM